MMKLNDQYISSFSIKYIFKRNSLIIKLKLSVFIKIHLIFYTSFLNHVITDPLPSQQQESQESVIVENDNQVWYVNCVLNFKFNRQYSFPFLKYYINQKDYFLI